MASQVHKCERCQLVTHFRGAQPDIRVLQPSLIDLGDKQKVVAQVTKEPHLTRAPGGVALPAGPAYSAGRTSRWSCGSCATTAPAPGPTSRRRPGLHRATVSNLMAELLDRRLVREVGIEHVGAVGRPRRAVALHGAHVGALGMEINVDYVAVHGTDLGGRVLVERRVGFDAMGSGPDQCPARARPGGPRRRRRRVRPGAVPAGIGVARPRTGGRRPRRRRRSRRTSAGTTCPSPTVAVHRARPRWTCR